ncbi:MAG: diaminopimelate epimerase [Oscillospiraceae bacterium]|nr:diaminopimelate epimerase [Oscillospiraceae bacterium]
MKFTKMQGAGNDFIIIDNRDGSVATEDYAALAAAMCPRRFSVGADGFIVVLPAREDGDFAMKFYNSDGSEGEMCGNGARCIAKYGYDHSLAGTTQKIETTAGLVVGQRIDRDLYCIRLNDLTRIEPEVAIPWEDQLISCVYIELGSPPLPHAVVRLEGWDAMDRSQLLSLGAHIRFWPAFPQGANVTFWSASGPNQAKAVTYERGVEDFTFACGTGAGSTAVAMRLAGCADDGPVWLDFPGGELTVALTEEQGHVTDIYLTGPAVTVATGDFLL